MGHKIAEVSFASETQDTQHPCSGRINITEAAKFENRFSFPNDVETRFITEQKIRLVSKIRGLAQGQEASPTHDTARFQYI